MCDKAKTIKEKIKELETQLENIQQDCKHDPVVKFNDELKSVVKECKICNKVIGYPTQQEMKENGFK